MENVKNDNIELRQKFQEKFSSFVVPNELSLLGLLSNETLLDKMQISYDDSSENFILSYDTNSGFLGQDESGKYVCNLKDDSFEIKHFADMSSDLKNNITYSGKILKNGSLSISSDRIFKNSPNDVLQREQFNYAISSDRMHVESISRKKGIYYPGSDVPENLEVNSSIDFFSHGAVVYDHLTYTEGIYVSPDVNPISILTEPYSSIISTMNSRIIPIDYKAGRMDDIRTEEQFVDFIVQAMSNNTINVNGDIISQSNDYINNGRTMGFTGIQLLGLVANVSSIVIALMGIIFLFIIR